jgi:hypothetical protein
VGLFGIPWTAVRSPQSGHDFTEALNFAHGLDGWEKNFKVTVGILTAFSRSLQSRDVDIFWPPYLAVDPLCTGGDG